MAGGTGELSRRNVRGWLGGNRASARWLDGVAAGSVLRRRRGVSNWSVDNGRRNGNGGDVNDRNCSGASRDFMLLGDVVGRSVDRLVTAVAGGGRLHRLLGLLTTVAGGGGLSRLMGLFTAVAWAGRFGWCGGDTWNISGRSVGLGDGVGDDRRTAVVANVDGGDGILGALRADSLGDGLSLGGHTSLARVDIGGGNNLDRVRRVVVCRLARNRGRVRCAIGLCAARGRVAVVGLARAGCSTVDWSRAGCSTIVNGYRGASCHVRGGARCGRGSVHRNGRAGHGGGCARGVQSRVVDAGAGRRVNQV
jgi:hypothetical protein